MKSRIFASHCLSAVVVLAAAPAVAQSPDQPDEPIVTRLPDGLRMIEGDIAVPLDFDDQRAAFETEASLWPGGVIPVSFGSNVTIQHESMMLAAMSEWQALANVSFVGRTTEDDYIHIQNATFNASEGIGRLGGMQRIWISSWTTHGTLVHELGHALAYWHEQSRADRNTYVDINFNNVCQTCCPDSAGNPASCNSQFTIRTSGAEHGPYDFQSVMHYDSCDFSNCATCTDGDTNCRTIDVLPPYTQYQNVIGQRVGASYWDGRIMSFLYPQPTWRFAADSQVSEFPSGRFLAPWVGFADGFTNSADNDVLFLYPGNYEAVGTWSEPKHIEPTSGTVVLGS